MRLEVIPINGVSPKQNMVRIAEKRFVCLFVSFFVSLVRKYYISSNKKKYRNELLNLSN